MELDIVALTAAYETLGTLASDTAVARDELAGLGQRPEFGALVSTDEGYNDVLEAQQTWDSDYASYSITYNEAVEAQKAQETLIINTLLPSRQWVRLTGLANWGVGAANQTIGRPVVQRLQTRSGYDLFLITSISGSPILPYPSLT